MVLKVGALGATGYADLSAALEGRAPSALAALATALTATGVAFKLAAVPAHAGMPDVAEGAPAPSSAFLTVAPKIGGAVALFPPPDRIGLRGLVAALALATMTLGNLAALRQDDARRLIGWSSVSQSGFALVAVAVVGMTPTAAPALPVFLFGYAVATLSAFAAVAHLRGRTAQADYAPAGSWPFWRRPSSLRGLSGSVS